MSNSILYWRDSMLLRDLELYVLYRIAISHSIFDQSRSLVCKYSKTNDLNVVAAEIPWRMLYHRLPINSVDLLSFQIYSPAQYLRICVYMCVYVLWYVRMHVDTCGYVCLSWIWMRRNYLCPHTLYIKFIIMNIICTLSSENN